MNKTLRRFEILLEVGNHERMTIEDKTSMVEAYRRYVNEYVAELFTFPTPTAVKKTVDRYRALVRELVESGHSTFIHGNQEVIVTESSKIPGHYQVTYFDEKGPIMDATRENIEEVTRYILNNSIVPIRAEYLEIVS